MNRLLICAGLLTLCVSAECIGASAAFARGGASNIMNSPGYQRRLQESRGYVANQSGSLFSSPPVATQSAPVHRHRKWRHRR